MRLWNKIVRAWRTLCSPPHKSKYKFEALSLTEHADISVYEDAINFAFANRDIKNVAISGAYGSGKSSVLASYKKKYPEKKFLHISLAHFRSDKKNGEENHKKCDASEITALEGKILNQLIHQVDAENIPQTNFRVKDTLSFWSVLGKSVAIIAMVVCSLHLILSNTWIEFVSTFSECKLRTVLAKTTTPYSFLCSACIIFVICAKYIYSVIKAQRYKAVVRKLSFQGSEIEILEEKSDSYFDKYLNEVLYLFENADVDAIVFEDMDRFEMEAIFERLREVNTLVNARLEQKNRKVIRFIFLLRDDIFVSKDRTKFFDYIIPVVPVVDSSNSYDQLLVHLERNGVKANFSEAFLQGVAIYIDDMRLLKNICNEYIIFHARLGKVELDPEKLLAIITYKNIYPRDYGQLQNNLGYVHAVFANKDEIIKRQISKLEEERKRLLDILHTREAETLTSKREIMWSYAVEYWSTYDSIQTIRNMDESTLDAKLRSRLSGAALKKYDSRIKRLEQSLSETQADVLSTYAKIEQKIGEINGRRLHEVIPHEEGVRILNEITYHEGGEDQEYTEIKKSQYFDLLRYLILNGYLDESYPDYMTYFYPNSLALTDKIFIRSVLDRKGQAYGYLLNDPLLVSQKLRVSDFDYDEVLNNALLDYLLKDETQREKLHHLLNRLRLKSNFNFVKQFLQNTKEKELFIRELNQQWPDFFAQAMHKQALSSAEIRQYSIDTLYSCDEELLAMVDSESVLSTYISSCADYLEIPTPRVERLITSFKLLKIKFHTINPHVSDRELIKRVYEESLYSLNLKNIRLMLVHFHAMAEDEDELFGRNYSCICSLCGSPILQYVRNQIDDYMAMWLEEYDGEIKDDENCVIMLLNNPQVQSSLKMKYITRCQTMVSKLSSIVEMNLWEALFEKKRISYYEENVITYWAKRKKLDLTIVYYLNEFQNTIDFSSTFADQTENEKREFFVAWLKSILICNKQYEEGLVSLGLAWDGEFDVPGIPIDKVEILVKNHIINMTPTTLRFMRANYPNAVSTYIQYNYDKYVGIMTTNLMVQNELLAILEWDVTEDSQKKLINMAPSPISIVGKKYSPDICTYILTKKQSVSDLPQLYMCYNSLAIQVKEFVLSYAIKNVDSIIRGAQKVSTELRCDMIASDRIAESARHRLLIASIKLLSVDEAKMCLEVAKKKEFNKIFNSRAKPKIKNDAQSKEILDVFKTREWIVGYSLNEAGNGYDVQRPTSQKKKYGANV